MKNVKVLRIEKYQGKLSKYNFEIIYQGKVTLNVDDLVYVFNNA